MNGCFFASSQPLSIGLKWRKQKRLAQGGGRERGRERERERDRERERRTSINSKLSFKSKAKNISNKYLSSLEVQ